MIHFLSDKQIWLSFFLCLNRVAAQLDKCPFRDQNQLRVVNLVIIIRGNLLAQPSAELVVVRSSFAVPKIRIQTSATVLLYTVYMYIREARKRDESLSSSWNCQLVDGRSSAVLGGRERNARDAKRAEVLSAETGTRPSHSGALLQGTGYGEGEG